MELLDRLYDPTHADVRVSFALARAEHSQRVANRATADQWAAIAEVVDEARRSPEVFVDPLLPLPAADRVDYAERAAAADVAVRLSLSEATVRAQAHDAVTLRARLPRVWSAFHEGDTSPSHARTAADLLRSLPDEPEVAARFDEALVGILHLAPARFRARARVLRERIHSIALAERAEAARATRGVWLENDVDGMAYLSMRLPAEVAHQAFRRLDALARSIGRDSTESRTVPHLRADVAGDLLSAGEVVGLPSVRVAVGVTVPVMTLLGHGEDPGILDGYGPIDAPTARRLAAHAPSFTRLLTHPISGALLDIDRTVYRPPADLKRWLGLVDQTCTFIGCGRLARNCDLDHTVDRQFGGPTSAANLTHLCRHHHRVKHLTRWQVTATREGPGRRRIDWTSPTGHRQTADPPPF